MRKARMIMAMFAVAAGVAMIMTDDLRQRVLIALDWARGRAAPKARYTLAQRLDEIGPAASQRLSRRFAAAGSAWPPADVALLALKDRATVELYARGSAGEAWRHVASYPVQRASGGPGPKLREGDMQVPEGIYAVEYLNPNSLYHVSMKLDYPNAFDREMARRDGRTALGGDIMIHGRAVSIGCLAMGDEAAEDLFVLAARVGLPRVKVVIVPTDFRRVSNAASSLAPTNPTWLPDLYRALAAELTAYPLPSG